MGKPGLFSDGVYFWLLYGLVFQAWSITLTKFITSGGSYGGLEQLPAIL